MENPIEEILKKQVLTVVKSFEEKIDDELAAHDDMEVLRERRLQQMSKMAQKRSRWIALGQGDYTQIPSQKDLAASSAISIAKIGLARATRGLWDVFFAFGRITWVMPQSVRAIVKSLEHPQRTGRVLERYGDGSRIAFSGRSGGGEARDALKVMDKYSSILAKQHIETRFIKINAEKSPFLAQKLKIIVLPTLALVKKAKVDDYVVRYEEGYIKVGFNELGGTHDFSTEELEERLAKAQALFLRVNRP